MDKLDELIHTTERAIRAKYEQIEGLEREIEDDKVRLNILKEASRLRPARGDRSDTVGSIIPPGGSVAEDGQKRRGGRQPGSISLDWRKTLVDMDDKVAVLGPLSFEDIFDLGQKNGVKGTLHSVRDRVRKYCDKVKLLERDGVGFRVKREVADRYRVEFGRPRPQEGPGLFDGGVSASPIDSNQEERNDATM